MLHTATVHGGVSNFEQSTPQGPASPPPVPLPLLLLLLLLLVVGVLSRDWPVTHATVHATESNTHARRKSLMRPTIPTISLAACVARPEPAWKPPRTGNADSIARSTTWASAPRPAAAPSSRSAE